MSESIVTMPDFDLEELARHDTMRVEYDNQNRARRSEFANQMRTKVNSFAPRQEARPNQAYGQQEFQERLVNQPVRVVEPLRTPSKTEKEVAPQVNDMRNLLSVMMSRLDKLEREGSDVETARAPTELGPSDSVSSFNRVTGRKLWKPDYNAMDAVIETEEEEDIERVTALNLELNRDENTVIRGFVKTRAMVFKEHRTMERIKAIPGLQVVFVNDRLNFLAHLHTALHELSKDDEYPPNDFVNRLSRACRRSPQTPQQELLQMVVSTTIDFSNFSVISNQFKIPILEVGMNLSEQYVYTAFDQLNNEYQIAYFETIKNLRLPNFHNKYDSKSSSYYGEREKVTELSGSTLSTRLRKSKHRSSRH